jgi:beta-phosphoglucomutase-like phosphatase (HAD superfamily)
MMLPHKPAAVIFDMDGLIFDTEALYQEAIIAAATEGGHDTSSGIFSRAIGRTWDQTGAMLRNQFGAAFPVDEVIAAMARNFDELALTRLAMKTGVVELLDTLEELHMPRAIATSTAHHRVQRHLVAHNLVGRFHEIVAHGDYAASKPAPDPFLKAAERLGVSPQSCLALEDSYNGVRSASAAGMMTVMVPDLLEPTDEIRVMCAFVVGDLHHVRDLILARVADAVDLEG